MKIYRVGEILDHLDHCIRFRKSFSHIRFGDGGLKLIDAILNKDFDQLCLIMDKEGLPAHKILDIYRLWGYYARKANYIDCPEVYFSGEFWPRVKAPGKSISSSTKNKMRLWRELYSRAEFDNENYCNPESNCLMIIDIPGRTNIFDIMKKRKICIITVYPEITEVLQEYDVDVVPIVGQWKNQYENSFTDVIRYIKYNARKYDCWLVGAGELGRIYSGVIKESGGRSIDIGFVIEYWLKGYLHPRFYNFVKISLANRLKLVLTPEGKKYEAYI